MPELKKVYNTEGNNETLDDRTPIPSGDYISKIVSSKYKPNSKKTGTILEFIFKVIVGKHKGSQVYANLNLENPSEKAVKISDKELNSICAAVGKVGVNHSELLHDIPITITVDVIEKTEKHAAKNEIKAYKKAPNELPDDTSGAVQQPAQQTTNEPPATSEATASDTPATRPPLPWEKGGSQETAATA